jgi:glycosyltransferase involved in cell wall biosynthesis
MGLSFLRFLNSFIYFLFRIKLYGKFKFIHCPSAFIAGELKKHHYNAKLYVISNGVSDFFKPAVTPPKRTDDKINVLMIGRLAMEKRQDLIIKAVNHSKYRDKIQLFFAGKGPMEKLYRRMGASLPNPPGFSFLHQEQLLEQIYKTDIYIHASDAEIEGISCIEALACGKVPIISDSKKSATSQFALDKRSLFKKGNYPDLRDKLDYWIEHPEERKQMETEYAKLGNRYRISQSGKKLEKMFEDAIKAKGAGNEFR